MRLIVQSMTTPCCSGGATSKRLVAHGGSASRWTRGTGLGSMSKPLTDPSFPSPHGQREWFMLSLNVSDHDIMITTWWACQCGVWMRLCLWLGLRLCLSLFLLGVDNACCWSRTDYFSCFCYLSESPPWFPKLSKRTWVWIWATATLILNLGAAIKYIKFSHGWLPTCLAEHMHEPPAQM